MKATLTKKLLEIGAIRQETEVEAYNYAYDISGITKTRVIASYIINKAGILDGQYIFEALSTVDGKRKKVRAEDILTIDGMDPVRFAAIYNLNEDGEKMRVGKRRGRKPKGYVAEAEEAF